MNSPPAGPTATPAGKLSVALVAGPPSPQLGGAEQAFPSPATVLILPAEETLRISWSPPSAMYHVPDGPSATACGNRRRALVAAPPSPHEGGRVHDFPVPATRVIVPDV